jgi:hypothetical protein
MGLTKSEIFTDKQNKLAGMMKKPKTWALHQKEIGALFAAYKGADNCCG